MFMYQEEPDAYEECFECMEKENRLDDVKYWFQAVLDSLYAEEENDNLEWYLEELGGYLGMKLPAKEIQVVRKSKTTQKASEPSGISGMLDAWKHANAEYFKSMINKGVNHVSV